MSKRSLVAAGLFVAACFFVGMTQAVAFPDELDDFVAMYPDTAGSKLDDCGVCHNPDGSRIGNYRVGTLNAYGDDFNDAGLNFAAIENMDSDGDGFTNLEEIVALTFPGDPADKPEDGGNGGGGEDGRILARDTIDASGQLFTLAAAADVDRDEALVVWGEATEARSGRAPGGLSSMLVDDEGSPIQKLAEFGDGDVSEDYPIAVAYADKKKNFAVVWTTPVDSARAQLIKSKKNKLSKTVAVDTIGYAPVVVWDEDLGSFVIAAGTTGGVGVYEMDTKGKVSRAPARFGHIIPDLDRALAFVLGGLDAGQGLFGAATTSKGDELGAAQIVDGEVVATENGLLKAKKGDLQVAAGMGDDAGLGVARQGSKVQTAEIGTDGSLDAKPVKLKGAKAGYVGVARQSDGTFLVVWVDSKKGQVMAVDRSADGKTTSKAFELTASGEQAEVDLLAVVPHGDNVLVVYVVDGDPDVVRTVVVGPAE